MQDGLIAGLFQGRLNEALLRIEAPAQDEETMEILLQSLDRFLDKEVDGAAIDREGKIPQSVLDGCKQLGLFGLVIPEEYGGLGLGMRSYGRVITRVATYCGATAVTLGAHQSIGLKALLLAGTDEQKRQWLPACATGERIGAYALTEPEAGSDAGSLRTTLRVEGDQVVLDGGKIWITNGGIAGLFTVFARDGDEIRAVLVPRETPGVSTGPEEHKLGIRGSSTTTLTFDNAAVPRENVIAGDGFRLAMDILNSGRTGLAAGTLGPAQVLLDLARERATTRRQFGRTLAEFALVRQHLAEMTLDLAGMQALVALAGRLIDGGAPHALEAAAAKIYCSEALWQIADRAIQLAGGSGYMSEYPYERILRDARINRIFEGANDVLWMLVALKGLKQPGRELKAIASHPLTALPRLGARALRRMRVAPLQLENGHQAAAQRLARAVKTLASSADATLRRHGKGVIEAQCDLKRLADMAIECTAMAAVLVEGSPYAEAFVERGLRRVERSAAGLGADRDAVAQLMLKDAS